MAKMTFKEKYRNETRWHEKILIMEIFHLIMNAKKRWTVKKTAEYFGVSHALASENLAIAKTAHSDPSIRECKHRQAALDRIKGREQ